MRPQMVSVSVAGCHKNTIWSFDQPQPLTRIVSHLSPGGCLVTGTHERLPVFDLPFAREEGCPWVYRLER